MMTRHISIKILRASTLLAFVAMGIASGLNVAVAVTQSAAPQAALAIDPGNGRALVQSLLAEFGGDPKNPKVPKDFDEKIKLAIQDEALNARALLLLGFAEKIRGNTKKSTEFLRMSNQLSRRVQGTQLLLVEDALTQGQMAQAVSFIDTAMRTSKDVEALLYPIFSQAMAYSEFRAVMVPYVQDDATWLSGFIDWSLPRPKQPVYWADLIERSGGLPKKAGYRDIERQLLLRLAEEKDFEVMKTLSASLLAARAGALKDITLVPPEALGSVVDWQLTSDANSIAVIYEGDDRTGPVLDIRSREGAPGSLARKLLMLTPGRYELSGTADLQSLAISMVLTCDSKAAPKIVGLQPLANGSGSFAMNFTVPASNCDGQYLDIVSRSLESGGQEGTAKLQNLSLELISGGFGQGDARSAQNSSGA